MSRDPDSAMSMSKKLDKAMAFVKSDELAGHRLIWSFSIENMDPAGVPQISALLYGAQRILLPEMHWDSTPDLLDIFGLAETIRQQTVADAREALVWDKFYRKDGHAEADGEQLKDEDRKTLKSLAKKTSDTAIRETYRTVVLQVCWAHIHRLRRSSETFRIPQFFFQYFPSTDQLFKSQTHQTLPLWLRGLSQAELVAFQATREKLMQFLEDAEQWEEAYFKNLSVSGCTSSVIRTTPEYQALFCQRFPLLVKWETLAGIILRHLIKIQKLFSKLHSIFPDDDSSSGVQLQHQKIDNQVSLILKGKRHADAPTTASPPRQKRGESIEMIDPLTETADQSGRGVKKESQESNVSKLSYVDVPESVPRVPPTSLLQRGLIQAASERRADDSGWGD